MRVSVGSSAAWRRCASLASSGRLVRAATVAASPNPVHALAVRPIFSWQSARFSRMPALV